MKTLSVMISLLGLLVSLSLSAQNREKSIKEIDFNTFNELVLNNNFEYLIEKFEVSVAEAAYTASRVFEDPELEIILPRFIDDEFSDMPLNIEFEMEIPIELFGKRKNRIRQARAEKYAAKADLEGFLFELRRDIASLFVTVIGHQMVIDRMKADLEELNRLVEINMALFEAGEIGEIELLQTRIEARNFEAELFDELGEMAEMMSEVYFLLGGIPEEQIVFTGNLENLSETRSFDELRENALRHSDAIIASRFTEEAAMYNMRLARSERFPDIALIAGYHNEEAITPSPRFRYSFVGVRIPIQFSGLNRGEYLQGVYEHEQSKLATEQTVFSVENELKRAWESYQVMLSKRLLFSEEILADSERVREAVLFSYQRGEASLLELIEAQRASNETFMNYYNTLADYNLSVIDLSRASYLILFDF